MTEPIFAPRITDDIVKLHHDYFVPAIYAQWAHHITDLAAIELGHSVLDVACRTGTLARAAKLESGFRGRVVGLDNDERMLAKARQLDTGVEWQAGSAKDLPFEDDQFDRVTCQFTLMFLKNKVAAIKEMLRVCKPNGMVCIAVWAPLSHSKVYSELVELTRKFAGTQSANKLASAWSLGATGKMDSLLLSAGANEYECHERPGVVSFPTVDSFVEAHLRAFGEYHTIDQIAFKEMLKVARQEFRPYLMAGGRITAALDADVFLIKPA